MACATHHHHICVCHPSIEKAFAEMFTTGSFWITLRRVFFFLCDGFIQAGDMISLPWLWRSWGCPGPAAGPSRGFPFDHGGGGF